MKTRTAAAALLACSLAACSDDAGNPVAPSGPGAVPESAAVSVSERTHAPTLLDRSNAHGARKPHWFDWRFYSDLVYGTNYTRERVRHDDFNWLLRAVADTNVLLYRGDEFGRCEVGEHSVTNADGTEIFYRNIVYQNIRAIMERGIGGRWQGQYVSTANLERARLANETRGWITIWFSSRIGTDPRTGAGCPEEFRREGTPACASYGTPGETAFLLHPYPDCRMMLTPTARGWWQPTQFAGILAHELGHNLGFNHVDGDHVMHSSYRFTSFTDKEARHMRFAYENEEIDEPYIYALPPRGGGGTRGSKVF